MVFAPDVGGRPRLDDQVAAAPPVSQAGHQQAAEGHDHRQIGLFFADLLNLARRPVEGEQIQGVDGLDHAILCPGDEQEIADPGREPGDHGQNGPFAQRFALGGLHSLIPLFCSFVATSIIHCL